MLKRILESIRRHLAFNAAYTQLSNLSDRELTDIGINRSMIKDLAQKSALGECK